MPSVVAALLDLGWSPNINDYDAIRVAHKHQNHEAIWNFVKDGRVEVWGEILQYSVQVGDFAMFYECLPKVKVYEDALLAAVKSRRVAFVRVLIGKADPGFDGDTCLKIALRNRDFDMMMELVKDSRTAVSLHENIALFEAIDAGEDLLAGMRMLHYNLIF